jgi:hypothetical protein
MAAGTYRTVLKESNGRKFTKTSKDADSAKALAEHTATLKITAGTIVSQTLTQPVATAIPSGGGGLYSDATFHFRNGTDNVNVHFEQLLNSYAAKDSDGNPTGFVDLTNDDIIAYAEAFDGGGWTLVEGRYVK